MLKFNFLNSLFICLLLNFKFYYSQNLVNNGSFELNNNSQSTNIFFNNVNNWYSPTLGTPDYYHVQNNDFFFQAYGVPQNHLGNSFAFDGNAYVGISVFVNQGQETTNAREYIQTRLINSLDACKIYLLKFNYTLSDSVNYVINKLGAALSIDSIYRDDFYCLIPNNNFLDVNNIDSLSINNRWLSFEQYFVSTENSSFLTIGNFVNDDNLLFAPNNNSSNISFFQSYYYIDNVSLTLFSDANTNIIAGNDTIVAPGDSIFIGQEIKGLNCTWRKLDGTFIADSTSGIWVQPTEETSYVVEQNLCGSITYDTVTVFVNPVGLKPLAEALEASGIVISPNPNNGTFEIQNPKKQVLTFELKNALGQVVYRDNIITEKQSFDPITIGLKLERGVYFATFSNGNGRFEEKIVVR